MDKLKNILIQNKKWIIVLCASIALYGGFKSVQKITEKQRKEARKNKLKIKPANTYEEFLIKCRPWTRYLVGFLANPEGFKDDPYPDMRGIWTIGYGSTILQSGKKVDKNTPKMSIDEAYKNACWHIEELETYYILYCYCCAFDLEMDPGEFLGLASFVYNGGPKMFEPDVGGKVDKTRDTRWAKLREIYRRDKGETSRDDIKEIFTKYPVGNQGSVFKAWSDGKSGAEIGQNMANYLSVGGKRAEGLVWRRWFEACLTAGILDPDDIMNVPVGGVFEFRRYLEAQNVYMINEDKVINYKVAAAFKLWLKSPIYWDPQNKKFYKPTNLELTKSIMPEHKSVYYNIKDVFNKIQSEQIENSKNFNKSQNTIQKKSKFDVAAVKTTIKQSNENYNKIKSHKKR